MALALELAHRITSQRFADLPPQALHWAKVGILDTVGTTLAGCHEDTACLAARALASGAGPSLLFGYSRRVPALEAALVNGAASHALDFDDCNNTIGGHPSAPVLSALFALADDIGASGQDFMTAYVVGFETETKLGLGVNMDHYTKGWHPTATLGVFGAAAACASLLRLSAVQTATALAIAASFASGIKANFGTMMKPLHVGHCARNGLYAALLAREGYTANTASAFEHKQGFFQVFNGTGHYDAARILPAWAHPWDIVDPGIAIKQYPCCCSTHPAIDALLLLLRVHDLQPAQVARLEAWIHERRLEHTNRPDPQSALEAKFSLQYCLVRALLDRQVIIGFCRKFSFEALCGMIFLHDQRYIMREHDDGDQFQRGAFPPRGHSDGGPLVCGVSAEHAPRRRTHARAWGPRGSLDSQPVGGQIQPAIGGSLSPAQAACLHQLAHG
jgi:2-methylcitrate dehydratase PrpD